MLLNQEPQPKEQSYVMFTNIENQQKEQSSVMVINKFPTAHQQTVKLEEPP